MHEISTIAEIHHNIFPLIDYFIQNWIDVIIFHTMDGELGNFTVFNFYIDLILLNFIDYNADIDELYENNDEERESTMGGMFGNFIVLFFPHRSDLIEFCRLQCRFR